VLSILKKYKNKEKRDQTETKERLKRDQRETKERKYLFLVSVFYLFDYILIRIIYGADIS